MYCWVCNCPSSPYQGIHYYTENKIDIGLMFDNIGGYTPSDIKIVATIDVDKRSGRVNFKTGQYSQSQIVHVHLL